MNHPVKKLDSIPELTPEHRRALIDLRAGRPLSDGELRWAIDNRFAKRNEQKVLELTSEGLALLNR